MRSLRLLAPIVCAALALSSCSSTSAPSAPSSTSVSAAAGSGGLQGGSSGAQGGSKTCAFPADGTAAKPATPPPAVEPTTGSPTATLALTGGTVTIALHRSATPCTVGSFVHLAQSGYFDGTRCHRLTTGSLAVLQCGDPSGTGQGGPGYSFADETTPSMTYPAGTVAMANAGPNTNGSQFFLVYADSQLPPDYTVFGTVTGGLKVLTTIAAAGVQGGGTDGAPATPVTISKVTIAG